MAAPIATLRAYSSAQPVATTRSPTCTQDTRSRPRAQTSRVTAAIPMVIAHGTSRIDGGNHSVTNWVTSPTANGASNSLGPTGVSAAATRPAVGTRASRNT